MKQLSLRILGAVALLTPVSAFATVPSTCGTNHPTCWDLGFQQNAADCQGYKAIKCPFDADALFCGDSKSKTRSNSSSNESLTCENRDCEALGYNRTEAECNRKHTRLACPFDDTKFYCGGYNCVAGDTLYSYTYSGQTEIGCFKGNDALNKTPIGFMLNDTVAIDLSYYSSAYSGGNYVTNIKNDVKGQVIWRSKGSQSSISCERKSSSANPTSYDNIFSAEIPCNGVPFTEIDVPYNNIFHISDYSQTFNQSGVAASGGYYQTTTTNNGYYLTNLLAQSGGFNINVDRFVPVCEVTAMSSILDDDDGCELSASSANMTKLKKSVFKMIHAFRKVKKSVGMITADSGSISFMPYMNSYPAALNAMYNLTRFNNLKKVCQALRRGNCATSVINENKIRPVMSVMPATASGGLIAHHKNRALRPLLQETYYPPLALLPETLDDGSTGIATPWNKVKPQTVYNCSCAMKRVPQLPMISPKELTTLYNPRLSMLSNTQGAATLVGDESVTRKIGVGSDAARLCAGRSAGGQSWFLPAPGDIRLLLQDQELLFKYHQALAQNNTSISVFSDSNMFGSRFEATMPSPETVVSNELKRTITSAVYLSNSSGNTGVCPLGSSSNISTRDNGSSTYNWDLQLSLLGDVVHCVTLVGVDASEYETTADVGEKRLCLDPVTPSANRGRFNSLIDARDAVVTINQGIVNDITQSFSNSTNSSYHDNMDVKGL